MRARNAWTRTAASKLAGVGTPVRRAIFEALYGRGARWYDRFTEWLFLGEWERWQRLALSELPERGTIVELGAGTAVLACAGASPERRWIAIERSPTMLAQAVRRRRAAEPLLLLLRADARAVPLPDDCCDAVVATFPSAYLLAPETQAEIHRLVVPGGQLVVVLSGELRPATPGRWARRVALTLFYGRSDPNAFNGEAIEGFTGSVERVESAFGLATVLRAERSSAGPI